MISTLVKDIQIESELTRMAHDHTSRLDALLAAAVLPEERLEVRAEGGSLDLQAAVATAVGTEARLDLVVGGAALQVDVSESMVPECLQETLAGRLLKEGHKGHSGATGDQQAAAHGLVVAVEGEADHGLEALTLIGFDALGARGLAVGDGVVLRNVVLRIVTGEGGIVCCCSYFGCFIGCLLKLAEPG